jgi:hypothetical protein
MCIDHEQRIFPGFQYMTITIMQVQRKDFILQLLTEFDDSFDLQDVEISESLCFVASREAASGGDAEADKELKIPITPSFTSYEKSIFEKMLPKFQKQTTNASQHTSYDLQAMTMQWNGMIWSIESGVVVKMKSGVPYFEKVSTY